MTEAPRAEPKTLTDDELVDEIEKVYDLQGLWTRPPMPLGATHRKQLEHRLLIYRNLFAPRTRLD